MIIYILLLCINYIKKITRNKRKNENIIIDYIIYDTAGRGIIWYTLCSTRKYEPTLLSFMHVTL